MSVSAFILLKKELYAVYGAEKLQPTVVLTIELEESSLEAGERSRGIYLGGAVNQSRSQRETIKPFPHIRQPAFQPQGHSYGGRGVFWPSSLLVTGAHKKEVHRGGFFGQPSC
jgi:hypothetical protein